MSTVGEPDMPPLKVAGSLADPTGAIMLAYGILAAIIARDRLGVGQEVNASLLGSMIWLQCLTITTCLLGGAEMPRMARSEQFNPMYRHYECSDGKWIQLALLQERHWADFCKVMELEELENDPRFENLVQRAINRKELVSILESRFASKPSDEWVEALRQAELLFCRVNTIADLIDDPQVTANDYIIEYDHPALGKVNMVGFPMHMSETPLSVRMPAPEWGQHTEEVLLELGYSWEDIVKLREEEVI